MSASFPSTIKTFTTFVNGDDIDASNQNEPNDEITAIETALIQGLSLNVKAPGFRFDDAASKTIASGAITITSGYIEVDTEAAAATDDLDTITIGTMADGVAIGEGSIIVLQSASNARIVTAKDGTGNLLLAGNFIFTTTDARLTLLHNGTNWVELARSQTGAWVTPTYSAGDYTASTGNWTVDSGDVVTYAYKFTGNTMTVAFAIATSDVSATPATLRIAIPASKTATKTITTTGHGQDAGGGNEVLILSVAAGGTVITIGRLSGNWTATSSDNTNVNGEITFEVNN